MLKEFVGTKLTRNPNIFMFRPIIGTKTEVRVSLKSQKKRLEKVVHSLLNYNLPQLFESINDPNVIYSKKTPILKILSNISGSFSPEVSQRLLDESFELFNDSADDDVSYHSSELYGSILANNKVEDAGGHVSRLIEDIKMKRDSYAVAALRTYIEIKGKGSRTEVEPIIDSVFDSKDLILTGGTRVLDFLAYISKMRQDPGIVDSAEFKDLSQSEAIRVAYVLHQASTLPKFTELVNHGADYQNDPFTKQLSLLRDNQTDPFVRSFINCLLDRDTILEGVNIENTIETVKGTTDDIVRVAAMRVLGNVNYHNDKDMLLKSTQALIDVIDDPLQPPSSRLTSAIYLTYGQHFLPQLDSEAVDSLTDKLWGMLKTNEHSRKYLPFFISRIYTRRSDFSLHDSHISEAGQIANDPTIDQAQRYESGRFLINVIMTSNESADTEVIKYCKKALLEVKKTDASLFDLLMQRYFTLIPQTSMLSEEQKQRYLHGDMLVKYLQSKVSEPFSRYLVLSRF